MNRIKWRSFLCFVVCLTGCAVEFGPGPSDFGADLVQGYRLVRCSSHIVMISTSHLGEGVEAKVVSLGFNDHFILARQQLLDANDDPIRGKYQYWIIDVAAKNRHGPFTEGEFQAKRKELGVSDEIKLRGKDSFRP